MADLEKQNREKEQKEDWSFLRWFRQASTQSPQIDLQHPDIHGAESSATLFPLDNPIYIIRDRLLRTLEPTWKLSGMMMAAWKAGQPFGLVQQMRDHTRDGKLSKLLSETSQQLTEMNEKKESERKKAKEIESKETEGKENASSSSKPSSSTPSPPPGT